MRKFLFFVFLSVFCSGAYAIEIADTFSPDDLDTSSSSGQMYGGGEVAVKETAKVPHTLANDTSDPLFMLAAQSVMSETDVRYYDEILRVGETLSYGLNDRFTLQGNIHYQFGFNHGGNGFSAFDLGAKYRMGIASDNSAGMVYDVLFGLKFGGSEQVRSPEYANSTYYAGLRFGKQWKGLSLAGTIKSNWIFSDERGMAYLNFVPEAYFRLNDEWRLGAGFDFLKSTSRHLLSDQEWMNFKLVHQFGWTQYVGMLEYEFEEKQLLVGFKLNILF